MSVTFAGYSAYCLCSPYLERVENWLAIGTQLQAMLLAYVALLEIFQAAEWESGQALAVGVVLTCFTVVNVLVGLGIIAGVINQYWRPLGKINEYRAWSTTATGILGEPTESNHDRRISDSEPGEGGGDDLDQKMGPVRRPD